MLIASVLVVAACSTAESETAPYAAEYAAAMAGTNSDYVKTMLEDGEITAAEIKDAQGQFISCLATAGIQGVYDDTGFGYEELTIAGELTPEQEDSEGECHVLWLGDAAELFHKQTINPNNEDFDSLIAQCLVRNGLVEFGFTGQDYAELYAPHAETFTLGPKEKLVLAETPEVFLPGGVSMNDARASACVMNPAR